MTKKREGFGAKPITPKERKDAKVGDVFIVRDRVFNPKANPKKSRRVVLVSKKGGNIVVAPVRNRKPYTIPLSKFDGNRELKLEKRKQVSRENVFAKRHFEGTKNDRLLKNERETVEKMMQEIESPSNKKRPYKKR